MREFGTLGSRVPTQTLYMAQRIKEYKRNGNIFQFSTRGRLLKLLYPK
jgi:hypothetical protein